MDGEQLLESAQTGDYAVAILARLKERQGAVNAMLERITDLAPRERELAFAQLVTLAGLRKLEELVEEEARNMPILNDIMDHKVLGREFKRGRQEGLPGRRDSHSSLRRSAHLICPGHVVRFGRPYAALG